MTHDALRAAERQLMQFENSVASQPQLYDKLIVDMGFGPGPTPELSLAMDASGPNHNLLANFHSDSRRQRQ